MTFHPGPFYHGTKAELAPGDLIEPNKYPPTTPDPDIRGEKGGQPREHTCFSPRKNYITEHYGPNVYEVEPTGDYTRDPEYTSSRTMFRSTHPLRVVRQVSRDWGVPNLSPHLPGNPARGSQIAAAAPRRATGSWYHGSWRAFDAGTLVEPGHEPNFAGQPDGYVYVTRSPQDAYFYARRAASSRAMLDQANSRSYVPHVYEVALTGGHEPDPAGERPGDTRSRHPARVIREDAITLTGLAGPPEIAAGRVAGRDRPPVPSPAPRPPFPRARRAARPAASHGQAAAASSPAGDPRFRRSR